MMKGLFGRKKLAIIQWVLLGLVFLCTRNAKGQTQDTGWPREIDRPKGKIMIYQPQMESFEGDKLRARAAVSVTLTGAEPVFGAVWFGARILTDRDTRTVTFHDVKVPDMKFPNATAEQMERLREIIEQEAPNWDLTIALDRLVTAMELVEKEKTAAGNLRNVPPVIRFVDHPAVLVVLDGKPELRPVENSKLMRVVNTPFLIALETASKTYYLKGGSEWFAAADVMGPWRAAANPPAEVTALATDNDTDNSTGNDNDTQSPATAPDSSGRKPEIIVATQPTELIISEGAPKYTPISGTSLLYMSNTDSDVFMEMSSQKLYVLLAGRWFTAKSASGPWSYVPSDKLPADFTKIPPDSEKGNVLVQVAGTEEAEEAVQEAYVPQTARIDRAKATTSVEYDGDPKFEPIDNTSMEYAVNTSQSVIKIEDTYYCCDDGVWYQSSEAMGPWSVCVSVPREVYTIPPSSPVYPVTYVQVYESTPTEVYVGYTSGYVGSYVYGGTVLFGTGFLYGAWYGAHHYYPRPVTYGWGAHYNGVTGNWGFRVGAAGPNGWIVGGYHNGKYYTGGWWAAGGRYGGVHGGWWGNNRYPVATPYRGNFNRNVNVGNVNIGNRAGIGNRYDYGNRNIYNRPGNIDRNIRPASGINRPVSGIRPGGASPSQLPANNVFADRNGNVYRRTADGWQKRDRNDWTRPTSPSLGNRAKTYDRSRTYGGTGIGQRPVTAQPRNQSSSRSYSLDRDYQARQRGTTRTNNYQRYQSSYAKPSSYRSSGGYQGGGGGGYRGGGGGGGRGGRR